MENKYVYICIYTVYTMCIFIYIHINIDIIHGVQHSGLKYERSECLVVLQAYVAHMQVVC